MKKLMLCLILGILLISSVSAWTSETFTENKELQLERNSQAKLGEYELTKHKWYDLFKIWEPQYTKRISLETNTDFCGTDCLAKGSIQMDTDGKIFTEIEWLRSFDNQKSWVKWNGFTNWQLYIENKDRYVEVPTYETICIDTKELNLNGTKIQDCSQVETGTKIIDNGEWNIYDFNKEYKADNYNWKLEGGKKGSTILDWILVTSEGVRLTGWAVWGNISTGSQAEVILNSPANNSVQLTSSITHNATANVTGGAGLVNASLWNDKGGWSLKDSSLIEGTISETFVTMVSSSASATQTEEIGMRINVTRNITLKEIYLWEGVTATRAKLYLRTGIATGDLLSTKDITNGKATFNYNLTYGTQYFVVVDKAGAGYTSHWQDRTFPYSSGNLTALSRVIIGTDESTANARNIKNMTFSESRNTYNEKTFTQIYEAGDNIIWNMQFCDTDGDCGFGENNRTFSIDNVAPTITLNYPTALIDYGKLNGTLQLNLTVTDDNLDSVWYDYNGTNITIAGAVSGVNNLSNITLSTKKNVTIYANDTAGNLNTTTFSWDYRVFENERTHNTTSYETAYETYSINLTGNSSLTAVRLLFNETAISLTESSSGFWTYSRDLPNTTIGNNSIYFNFTYAGEQISSDTTYQNISNIDFNICSANPYLNISFKDENSLEFINASIPTSEFIYYLGTGTQNKTLTYSNTTDNFNYGFCFTPIDRSIKVLPTVQYRQVSDYPQRIWEPTLKTYTNSTTNQTLYLLNTNDGIFVTYQVISIAESPISGVNVIATRVVSGETIQIGAGTTDTAGAVTFWMNPDFQHTLTFTKEGYDDYTFTHFPTQNAYTITLGSQTVTETSLHTGISFVITPQNTFLDENTIYNFTFSLSSTYWELEEFGFRLYTGEGVLLGSNTSVSSSGGTLSINNINTSNYESVYVNAYYTIDGEQTDVSLPRFWNIQITEGREFSIWQVAQDLTLYTSTGLFGFDDFGKRVISVLLLILLVGGLSRRYGIASEGAIMGMIFATVFLLEIGFGILPEIIVPVTGFVLPTGTLTAITFIILLTVVLREERR